MNNKLKTSSSINRLERKWALSGNVDLNAFSIAISKSNFFFREIYSPRSINTVYFDDTSFSSINENLDGVTYKKKFRLRWYGDHKIISKPQLEIKSKVGFITKKKTFLIDDFDDTKFDYEGIVKISNIFQEKLKINKILKPILSTHYLRYYFLSHNKNIRSTFDVNLRSHQLFGSNDFNFKKDFNNQVFEIKYNKIYDSYVKNNLKDISFRMSKSSKYIISALNVPISFS